MIIKRLLIVLSSVGLALLSGQASALSMLGVEPPASKIFNSGNDLEWVYAAPCAGENPSCGVVQLHHDFRFATAEEWISSFLDLDGLIAAFDLNNYDSSICAAPEFSTVHNHCDPSNAISGYIWHAPVGIAASEAFATTSFAETFLVRGERSPQAAVPAPASLALLGLGLAGLAWSRRKKA